MTNNFRGVDDVKIFHTADWHLGKIVQGVSMVEDQAYILNKFLHEIEKEQPDVVIIAGDIYDRAIPPPEAIELFDRIIRKIVLDWQIPVLAIAGNHDSPTRLHFGTGIMRENGFYLVSQLNEELLPVILSDEHGDVHFHLIPYTDPSIVKKIFKDESIKSHEDAMKVMIERISKNMDSNARHVFVGHAFVTPYGEEEANTSDSEKPLSIGGAEFVNAHHFEVFDYTALGHLHQAHKVLIDKIRYAGSPLKYSISEEKHKKGFYIVNIDRNGEVLVEKRDLQSKRDMRTVEKTMDEILTLPINEDYVFVKLLDEQIILSPMEKVRAIFPNAMHVERSHDPFIQSIQGKQHHDKVKELSDLELFTAFYKEMTGKEVSEEMEMMFKEVLDELLKTENETIQIN